MPPGAKKRKALKKKKQQQQQEEATGSSTNDNGDNLHGGNGSQDDRESDSNLSSPGSQGNEQFGGTKDSSGGAMVVKKDTAKEISDVVTLGLVGGPESGNDLAAERGTGDEKIIMEKSLASSNGNTTQTAENVASEEDPCVKEIAPAVVDSFSRVVVSEKSEHAETSTHPKLAIEKSGETKENGKVAGTLLESATGTSKKVESGRASEVPVSSEEKRLLLPGPSPPVRTSWLSCCGLFDAMTGSDR